MPGNIYKHKFGNNFDSTTNELVIRIQPKESIYMRINNKVGFGPSYPATWKCQHAQLPKR